MPLTRLDGLLFGERHGAGPIQVVALHGWGRDRRDFRRVLKDLDAVAVDLPGFGATPPPDRATGAEGYAGVVAAWIEQLPDPQVLVGHSFGGRVAVVLAATRPELVAGLVLVGVPLLHRLDRTARRPSIAYRLVHLANRAGLISDERLEREKRRRGSDDYRAATGVMRDTLVTVVNESYEDFLLDVVCPVVLVWGAGDSEVPLEVAYRAGALLDYADLEVVEDCGHDVPGEAPDRLRAVIETLI